jgi:hypothetical protein
MKIDINKQYISNGKPVRILCVDRQSGTYPIIGIRNNLDIEYFTKDGRCITGEAYDLIEQWKPQEGEWCWFWDELADGNAHLRRYLEVYSERGIEFFKSIDGVSWQHCAKFSSELPEHLKGL